MIRRAIPALREIFGERFSTSRDQRIRHSYDATGRMVLPDAVAFPASAEEVRRAVLLANEHRFPVLPRGAGSGFSGGAVPVRGGLVLSTRGLARIVSFDEANQLAVVEPGVVTGTLKDEARKRGLFYPPDPGSLAFCTIGGNIAECAGGMCAVKYGVTRDYVLGLEAVLGTGELVRTGVSTRKGVVGYDLTRLLVGSEGTLGIVTQATLKLIPLPETVATILSFFRTTREGAAAVAGIIADRITPCALELMDRTAVDCVRETGGLALPEEAGCALLIEVDGSTQSVAADAGRVERACRERAAIGIGRAADEAGRERLWALRRAISPSLRKVNPVKINEDIVVPRSRLPDMMSFLVDLGSRLSLRIVTFGHAGDGNVHVNLMISGTDAGERRRADGAVAELFRKTIDFGGTISGEHGVGIAKAPFFEMEVGPSGVSVMKRLKGCFDPNGILNPGKIFEEEGAVSQGISNR